MSYAFDFALSGLTPGLTDLRAQLVDTTGANAGSPLSTGFIDQGSGFYQWHAAAIPAGHQGGVKFYSAAAPAVTLALMAINPQINEVWSNATRTLTQTAQQIVTGLTGSTITVSRGDSFSVSLTGLGNVSSYVSLDFTIKYSPGDADADAVLRIRKNASASNDGLLVLNGAPAPDATQGYVTIDNAALGNMTIVLSAADAALLAPDNYVFDVQMITAAGVTTLTNGTFIVSADVTRATS